MKENVNLLEGPIVKSLMKLALPITASSLASFCFNIVDTFWIGTFLGVGSVTAVGTSGMLLWFMEGLLMLASIGGSVYTAQALGNKDINLARKYAKSCLQFAFILGIFVASLMIFIAPYFIKIFNISEQKTIDEAIHYIIVFAPGMFFAAFSRSLTGLATAMGNSRIDLMTNLIGIGLNIILDPIFIFYLDLGVIGASLASSISLFVIVILFYLQIHKSELFKNQHYLSSWHPHLIFKIFRLSLPASLQTFFLSTIAMYIGRIVAFFGDSAIAVQKIGVQIESISWRTTEGFSSAIKAFMAQNFGANQLKRAKRGYFSALGIITILGVFTTLLFYFKAESLFSIFLKDPNLIPIGADYIRIMSYSQYAMCIDIMTSAAFNGFGKTILPSSIVIIFTLIRIPLIYLLAFQLEMGLSGIWWAITISAFAKGLLLFIAFIIYINRTLRLQRQENIYLLGED